MANSSEQEQSQPLTDMPSAHQTPAPSVPTNSFLRFQQRTSAARHRPGYARVPSVSFAGDHESQSAEFANSRNIQRPGLTAPAEGLGIDMPQPFADVETIITKPAWQPNASHNIVASPEQATPGSIRPMMSPPSTAGLSGTTTYDSPYAGFDTGYKSMSDPTKQSFVSIQSTQQPSYANSEAGLLYGKFKDKYDSFAPEHHCQSSTNIKGKRFTWLSVTIFVLAIYSTAMSLVFFALAAKGQRYGEKIRTGGSLTISGATVLTTFFAKTIELSFVTVIVALLGQALARRAYDKDAVGGITLAEIGMRSWILQPGTLVTHWEGVKYASLSLLGATSLAATVLAMLYVTAANALVQPQLKFHAEWRPMQGLVKTSFANPDYVKKQCETPITATIDPVDGGPTCMQLEHAANAFHNYYAYLSTWSAFTKAGNGTGDLRNRPQGYATLNDTTKITGAWIEQEYGNMTELNELYGHVIVNVSLAMPHAGVIGAAKYSENEIMQPEDLDGQGLYRIHASVPSPVIHVTCAMLSKDYLRPVVASLANYTLPKDIDVPALNTSDVYRGGTSLDDIFGWGPSYGEYSWPPVFPKLPLGYNTMINDTLRIPYGRDSIYLLGNSTIESTPGAIMSDPPVDTFIYPLCQMRVSQTPYCSTSYNASSSGATLAAHCEDKANPLLYINSLSNATSGRGFTSREWPNIAGELFKSLALNDGTVDGNGSNARVLTQLVPKKPALDPALPSIAEAIAVMAGSTLLQSTKDAPFVEFFNYTAPSNIIDPGHPQWFNASIEAQQYASGGTAPYQRGFLLILFAVFFLNLLALIYFITHRDWYADLSEPSNLFSLAINSPPSKELAGSCGGGPHGKQFRSAWRLQEDGGHVYMESMDRDTSGEDPGLRRRRTFHEGLDILMSPVRKTTAKFSSVPDK